MVVATLIGTLLGVLAYLVGDAFPWYVAVGLRTMAFCVISFAYGRRRERVRLPIAFLVAAIVSDTILEAIHTPAEFLLSSNVQGADALAVGIAIASLWVCVLNAPVLGFYGLGWATAKASPTPRLD